MKILILSDNFPPQTIGGAELSIFGLAHAFRKRGHEVFVITTCQEKKLCGEENLEGLKIFRIFSKYPSRWRAYLSLYNPQTVGKVRQLLQEIKPDIVHANNIHYHLSYFCLKLARRYSKGVFLTARDVMLFNYGKLATKKYLERFDYRTCWLDHLKQAQKRYNPFRNIIIRHYLESVDKVFAISNALKEALNQNNIQNVEVIYNGIDMEDWKINPELVEEFKEKYKIQNKKVILFGGRISKLKGLEKIQQAMVRVKKEIPESFLLVIGKDGIGWLSGSELRAAFHSADVVVMPSICFDAFGRANIEAMACRKPVVGTCYGGIPEVIQDGVTGFIVNPFNIELMATKIVDLLKNPKKAKEFGEAGYLMAKEKFNLENQADKYLKWFTPLEICHRK
ncbi:MAG: glycosyltransferase family 4 protein [bacterium]|nr:glycosyltransferase family 4 protein [bacterium]